MSCCDHSLSIVRPSSVHTFEWLLLWNLYLHPQLWTTSPLKLLGQFSAKRHVEPSVKRRLKICTNSHDPLSKMAAVPMYRKNTKNFSSPEPRKLWGWILLYSIGNPRSTKFLGCPLTFLHQGQICIPILLYGENVEKSFSQNVLKANGWNL